MVFLVFLRSLTGLKNLRQSWTFFPGPNAHKNHLLCRVHGSGRGGREEEVGGAVGNKMAPLRRHLLV